MQIGSIILENTDLHAHKCVCEGVCDVCARK